MRQQPTPDPSSLAFQSPFDTAARHTRLATAIQGTQNDSTATARWLTSVKPGPSLDSLGSAGPHESLSLLPASQPFTTSNSRPVGARSQQRDAPPLNTTMSSRRSSIDSQSQDCGNLTSDCAHDEPLLSSKSSTCASQGSCLGKCSAIDCESICNPFDHSTESCSTACLNTKDCSGDGCCQYAECVDLAAQCSDEYNGEQQFCDDDFSNLFNYDVEQPMTCRWLDTDQPCEISASTKADLRQHVFQEHIEPQTQQICEWDNCHQTVDSQHFTAHFLNNHQPESYICLSQGCGSQFSDAEQLAQHMEIMHGPDFSCHWAGCEVARSDPAELTNHVNNEHLNSSSEQFLGHPRLLPLRGPSHSSALSSSTQAASEQHGSQISTSSAPTTPMNFHTIETISPFTNPYTCKWISGCTNGALCGAEFSNEYNLQQHVELVHTKGISSNFVCRWQLCRRHGKPLQNKRALDNHMRVHAECESKLNEQHCITDNHIVNTLICSHCKKHFDDKTKLANHERSHTKEKPYICQDCGSSFSSKESLSMRHALARSRQS